MPKLITLKNLARFKTKLDEIYDELKIPTKTSELENDSGFITVDDIPPASNIPTKTSELENDSGFITIEDVPDIPDIPDAPSKTSELENDSGFITIEDIPDIPSKTSELENDSGFITVNDMPEGSTVDSDLSATSTNAVQNKVITNRINNINSALENVTNKASNNEQTLNAGMDWLNSLETNKADKSNTTQNIVANSIDLQNGFTAFRSKGAAFSVEDATNIGIEIGRRDGTPGTPYFDFHTDGSSSTDYNSRLIATGNQLNVNAEDGLYVNGKKVSTSGLPLGMLIPSSIVQNDAGLHLADGSILWKGGAYDEFCTWALENIDNIPTTDTDSYFDEIALYGQCGKYVVTEDGVRLPTIVKHIEGLTNISEIGTALAAGLPNITGSYSRGTASENTVNKSYMATGAFAETDTQSTQSAKMMANSSSNYTGYTALKFSAQRSNSIYGNSDTVQTQSVKYPYYIVVATTTKTDIEVNIDNIATDLNNKADRTGGNINKDNFRLNLGIGDWVNLGDNAITITPSSTSWVTADLSSLLPSVSNGEEYEILAWIVLGYGSSDKVLRFYTDIFGNSSSNTNLFVTGSSRCARQMARIPLKRYLYYQLSATGGDNFFKILAYRRIK